MTMHTVGRQEFYDFIRIEDLRRGDTETVNDEPKETRTCWHRFSNHRLEDKPLAMLDKLLDGVEVTYWIDRE